MHPSAPDIETLLLEVVQAPAVLRPLAAFAAVDGELMRQLVQEAARFVQGRIAPLRRSGDEVGCRWHDGAVTTPPGFKEAYAAFWQAGWPALCCATEDGGQGLPAVMSVVLYEMLSGANHGWTMAPGILHGAYECLRHHGSESLRRDYLPKIASGEWLATMCLTEAHAGSDLGLARTRAEPVADGSWRVHGTKIFISGGEHDLTDNIVHLVLARAPEAPAGSRGLSLFLVPKFLPDGTRNTVHCEGIEHKMGLHGSPTCTMRFEGATGWRIGEPNRGLAAMFVMMNSARLHVAMQGLGLLETAWQIASAYARERRQMRAPGVAAADGPSPIVQHPAVSRLLDTQRAWIDGGRVLAYHTALQLDLAEHHPEPKRQAAAKRWCALVTPVLKSAFTAQAFQGASDCLQVLGGHGYIRESGVEQVLRDARVTMIYEGTNEIQAADLLVRKVVPDGGAALGALLADLAAELDPHAPEHSTALRRIAALQMLTAKLVSACNADETLPYWVAEDFLRAVALGLLSWAWSRIGSQVAGERWTAGADALRRWVLPEFDMRLAMIARRIASDTRPAPLQ